MEQILMATDVNIKTSTVEVKVMKIGNRQVTLAVFRQLPEEPIIHPDTGKLCGVPWGRVNYHVGCEEIKTSHMHIVWQKGGELRRSIAFLPWKSDVKSYLPRNFYTKKVDSLTEEVYLYLAAHTLEGWKPARSTFYGAYKIEVMGVTLYTDLDVRLCDPLQEAWNFGLTDYDPSGKEHEKKAARELRQLLSLTYGSSFFSGIIFRELHSQIQQIKPTMDVWKQSYAQLEQLDQIFIAV